MKIRELIMEREMTVSEITSIFIEHVKDKNPSINFLTEDRFSICYGGSFPGGCLINGTE